MLRSLLTRDALIFFGSLLALTTLAVVGSNAVSYQPPFTLTPYSFLPSLAYSVAWFLLVLSQPWRVFLAAATLFVASAALFFLWLLINATLFMVSSALAPAAIGICTALLGLVHGLLHVGLIRGTERPWISLHVLGYAAAGLLFMVPMYDTPRPSSPSWIKPFVQVATNAPVLMFVPHAVWSWLKLRAEGYSNPPRARAAIVFVCAYIAFSAYLWRINPSHWTLAWPVRYREMANAAYQDQKDAEGTLKAMWGTEQGRTLTLGESVTVRINDINLDLRMPNGWLARASSLSRPHAPGHDWFVLRRTGAATAPLVDRIRVAPRRWETAELRSRPEPKLPGANYIRRERLFRCGPGAPRTAGLIACTPADEYSGRRQEATAPDGLFAAPQGGSNFVFHTMYPSSVHGSVSVLGKSFLAGCHTPTTCTAVFSFAAGGAAAEAEFPANQLHRWREIRPEVDALLRSATGRGLDDGVIVSQPEGELLPLPR